MHRVFLRAHEQRPRQSPFCQFADLPHLGSTAVNWLCTRKGSSARVRHAGGCRWRTRPFPQQVDAQALRTRKGRVRQFARVPAPRAAPRPRGCERPKTTWAARDSWRRKLPSTEIRCVSTVSKRQKRELISGLTRWKRQPGVQPSDSGRTAVGFEDYPDSESCSKTISSATTRNSERHSKMQ